MFETIIDGETSDTPSSTTAPVKSVSITNLIQVREGIRERFETIARLLGEAQEMAKSAQVGFPRLEMENSRIGRVSMTGKDLATQMMRPVDAEGWQYLMKESGLLTFMDHKARRDWSEKVYALDTPTLTAENIEATFSSLHAARGDMMDRGVIALFRSLSYDYKANKPCFFGKKIIIDRLASLWGSGGCFMSFHSGTCETLDDLDRVFHKLAKLPEPDHRNGWYHRLSEAQQQKLQIADGPFFSVKFFKKGSGHVLFKDMDGVAKLNSILSRHHPDALPSPV